MAYISGAFDMGKAQTNATYAYTAWVNYTESGNTLGITEDEFKELESHYRSSLGLWKQWAEEADATEYDITEEEFYDEGHQQGVDRAETKANYDGDNKATEQWISGGAVTAGVATSVTITSVQGVLGGVNGFGAWCITAPLSLAIATAAMIMDNNKKAADGLKALKELMDGELPTEIQTALNKLSELEANVVAARDNAAATREQFDETAEGTQGEIAEYQNLKAEKNVELTEAQLEKATLEAQVLAATEIINSIQARVDAGEEVSPEELNKLTATQANVATLNGQIAALGEKIKELAATIHGINNTLLELSITLEEEQKDGVESTGEDSAQIQEEQAAYDEQGKAIAEKQGILDEAASYDEQTIKLCNAEIVNQSVNIALATLSLAGSTIAACFMNFYAMACSAMSIAAIALSSVVIHKQGERKDVIEGEIASRNNAQNLINSGIETYDYHLDNWNNMNEHATVFNYGISEFELEEPDLSEPEVENG